MGDDFRVTDKALAKTPKKNSKRTLPKWAAKADPRVWEAALKMAKGDVARLSIDKEDLDRWGNASVIVSNPRE